MIEAPTRIEPCGIEEMIPEALSDLVVAIRAEAAEIGRSLHPDSVRELRGLVRIMNAYYSNLIEGHNTRPRDIEAALRGARVDLAASRADSRTGGIQEMDGWMPPTRPGRATATVAATSRCARSSASPDGS